MIDKPVRDTRDDPSKNKVRPAQMSLFDQGRDRRSEQDDDQASETDELKDDEE